MSGIESFLNAYGLPAIAAVLLIKSIGVPIPIPADVIMLAASARVNDGKLVLWQAFSIMLVAIVVGDAIQFLLARGPGRSFLYRFGRYVGLNATRLDAATAIVKKRGPIGLSVIILTPGVRAASVAACGLADVPIKTFAFGLILGEGVFLALHFFLGSILGTLWNQLTSTLSLPLTIGILVGLLLIGLGAWIVIRRKQQPTASRREVIADAIEAWHEATCPVCLTLGAVDRLNTIVTTTSHVHAQV
jgi:membrane protein DedA with SNARE-associated domain